MYDYFNRMRFKPYRKRMDYDASNGRLTLASIKRILIEQKVPLNVRQANGETPRQLRMGTLAELSRSSENRKVVYERKYMRIMSLRWYVINAPWKQCTNHWGAAENAKTLRNLCQKGYLKKYFDWKHRWTSTGIHLKQALYDQDRCRLSREQLCDMDYCGSEGAKPVPKRYITILSGKEKIQG